jgi:hypothetical protein
MTMSCGVPRCHDTPHSLAQRKIAHEAISKESLKRNSKVGRIRNPKPYDFTCPGTAKS